MISLYPFIDDINQQVKDSLYTPLAAAVVYGSLEIISFLLNHGANIEKQTSDGFSPLALAVFLDKEPVVRLLLKYGAYIYTRTKENLTPLHIAAHHDRTNMIKILIEYGSIVDITGSIYECTPFQEAIFQNSKKSYTLLHQYGSDVNFCFKNKRTALHIAASYNNVDAINFLVSHGACVDSMDEECITPLLLALLSQSFDAAKTLILCGANINHMLKGRNSILHILCKVGNLNQVKFLCQYHPDINVKSIKNRTPLMYACFLQKDDIVKFLISHGANIYANGNHNVLGIVARTNNYNLLKFLIPFFPSVNFPTIDGITPLHFALLTRNLKILDLLLQNGANINHPDKLNYTPLHYAIITRDYEIVKYLISKGANLLPKTCHGVTPLTMLIGTRAPIEIIKYILKAGAPLYYLDNHYLSLFDMASTVYPEVLPILVNEAIK